MDKNAITLGLQIGRILAGQRRTRVPVAYLYNGVRLPRLPEWDAVTYPCAYICEADGVYYLTVRSEPQDCMEGGKLFWHSNYPQFACNDGVWAESSNAFPITRTIVWANRDVYYSSEVSGLAGTLYLAASEPVPV